MIHHHRGNRRLTTKTKTKRKLKIIRNTWGENDTGISSLVFGKFRKGKVHCSCPICASKTNSRQYKSAGRMDNPPIDPETGHEIRSGRGSRIAMTNSRYGKKNYSIPDRKKMDDLTLQLREYEAEGMQAQETEPEA